MPFVVPQPLSHPQDLSVDDDISSSPILVPTDFIDFPSTAIDSGSSSSATAANATIPPTPLLPASVTDDNEDGNDDNDNNDDGDGDGDSGPFAFLHPSWSRATELVASPPMTHRRPLPRPTSPIPAATVVSRSSTSSALRMRSQPRTFRPPQPPAFLRHHHHHHRWAAPSPSSSSSHATSTSSDETAAADALRARHRLRAFHRGLPTRNLRRSYRNSQYCLGESVSALCNDGMRWSRSTYSALNFSVVMEDGGRYSSSYYSVENILRNDDSVYCSGRSGTINILLQYRGFLNCNGRVRDKSCVISRIVIKSPQHGFTAPCKEGMFFVSHAPIDVDATSKFDHFTHHDYEKYVEKKGGPETLDDADPVAWFSIANSRQDVIELNDRASRYVLIKLVRAENESENIDLQHVALIGYCGARAFGSARLC